MEIKEAVNVMKKYTDISMSKTVIEAHNMAIDALQTIEELLNRNFTLEDLENYKQFEDECVKKNFTFKSLLEAREKQIPKKVVTKPWSPARCPSCECELSEDLGDGYYKHYKYLRRCLNDDCCQMLDWSDEDAE